MPRLGGGNYTQSYLVGMSQESNNNNNNNSNDVITSSSVTATATATPNNNQQLSLHQMFQQQQQREQSRQEIVEPAPSSFNSLPRVASLQRASLRSSSTAIAAPAAPATPLTSRSTTHAIPAPSSLKQSSSMFLNRPERMYSTTQSPFQGKRRTFFQRHQLQETELPLIAPMEPVSDTAPRKPNRTILRAAEGGKGTLLPEFASPAQEQRHARFFRSGSREPPNRARTRSSPSLAHAMNLGNGDKKKQDPSSSAADNNNNKNKNKNDSSSEKLPQTQQDLLSPPTPNTMRTSIIQAAKQSLRRRTASSCPSDDDCDNASTHRNKSPSGRGYHSSTSYNNNNNNNNNDYDLYKGRRGSRRTSSSSSPGNPQHNNMLSWQMKVSRMKLGNLLQVLIVLAVTVLVWESHHKALFAAEQLSQFKEEESLLLLHLQKIEQQSIQLHENLSRIAAATMAQQQQQQQGNADGTNPDGSLRTNNININNKKGGPSVDVDLIHKQTQQLYQMEEELNHEVHTLQSRIQQSARNHIISEFGEGPIQVILELDFPGDTSNTNNKISILLWHDTPHAAWTWLEQIGRHIWDGAHFQWQHGHIMDAVPIRLDPNPGGGKIEFVEQSQHGHEAWTVGLRESSLTTEENGNGGGTDTTATSSTILSMYINLQDNSNLHKHETCVGKIIDGFDALQRLLELSRSKQHDKNAFIAIRKASAVHVTNKKDSRSRSGK